jgi:hypothetical protein
MSFFHFDADKKVTESSLSVTFKIVIIIYLRNILPLKNTIQKFLNRPQ